MYSLVSIRDVRNISFRSERPEFWSFLGSFRFVSRSKKIIDKIPSRIPRISECHSAYPWFQWFRKWETVMGSHEAKSQESSKSKESRWGKGKNEEMSSLDRGQARTRGKERKRWLNGELKEFRTKIKVTKYGFILGHYRNFSSWMKKKRCVR